LKGNKHSRGFAAPSDNKNPAFCCASFRLYRELVD